MDVLNKNCSYTFQHFYNEGKHEHPKPRTIGEGLDKSRYSPRMKCCVDIKHNVEDDDLMKWGKVTNAWLEGGVTKYHPYNWSALPRCCAITSHLIPTKIPGWVDRCDPCSPTRLTECPRAHSWQMVEPKCKLGPYVTKFHQMYHLRLIPGSTATKMKDCKSWRMTANVCVSNL